MIHGLEYLVREARDTRHAAVVPAAAGDGALHPRVPGDAAPSEGRPVPLPQAARADRTNTTRRSTNSSASTSRARSSSRRSRTPSRATRPIRSMPSPHSPRPCSGSPTAQMEHMGLEAKVIIPAARVHLTPEDWREIGDAFGANGDPRFSVDADEEYRQLFARILNLAPEGVVGNAAATTCAAQLDDSNYRAASATVTTAIQEARSETKTMQHARQRHCDAPQHLGGGAALAIAALFARVPAVQAFEIDTGNPDLEMRWDNTVRYNLGVRAQSQNSGILGARTTTTATAISATARSSPTASTYCPSSTSSSKRNYGLSRERGGAGTTTRTADLDNTNNATAEHAGQRAAGRRRAEPLHEALSRRARRANGSTRSRSPISTRATCRSTSRPASTPCTGATACCWAARSTACRTRRTRSTSGRASRRRASEAKELFRPRGGITLQTQPTKDLSMAGQWFYNWQAVPRYPNPAAT